MSTNLHGSHEGGLDRWGPPFIVPPDQDSIFSSVYDWGRGLDFGFRVSHQPNFLAYWRLIGQFLLADSVRRKVLGPRARSRQITFLLNDYDAWRDPNLRRAEFPEVNGNSSGRAYIGLRTYEALGSNVVFHEIGRIPDSFADNLRASVGGYLSGIREFLTLQERRVFSRATRNVVEDVVRVASDCTTWVQFCSAYILFVLERCGVKDVEVVSGFEKMLANQTLMRSVAERVAEALDDGRDAIDLVWGFCDSCKSRFRPEAAGFSYCGQCSRKWDPARDLMLPKILVDNLMDDELFPRTLSFCHIGGMSHIVEGHQMRTIMQLQPTSLDVVSDQGSRSDYNFQFIAEAAARRVVHSVDAAKIRGLYDRSRSGYFSSLYYLVGDEYAALRNA